MAVNKPTGQFIDQKKAPAKKPFKGVRKEKKKEAALLITRTEVLSSSTTRITLLISAMDLW